jgi:adenine/guanine phosphoribosyltransferase-like PRPP-binding protein
MPARSRGRASFDFQGQPFVWWIDGDRWLRIASSDKRFVVALPLLRGVRAPVVLTVTAQEFPDLASASRPAYVIAPATTGTSPGAIVSELLGWAFDPARGPAATCTSPDS